MHALHMYLNVQLVNTARMLITPSIRSCRYSIKAWLARQQSTISHLHRHRGALHPTLSLNKLACAPDEPPVFL